MRPDRQRRRDDTIRVTSPTELAIGAIFVIGLLALYRWWPHWPVLLALAVALLGMLFAAIRWFEARSSLRRDPAPVVTTRLVRVQELRDDPELGTIEWQEDEESWCVGLSLDGETVVVRLEGTRAEGPSDAARALWLSVAARVPELWSDVVHFACTSFDAFPLVADDLALTSIHAAPAEPLDGGELIFFFEVATDPNGTYCVPLHDGRPLYVHRDS